MVVLCPIVLWSGHVILTLTETPHIDGGGHNCFKINKLHIRARVARLRYGGVGL